MQNYHFILTGNSWCKTNRILFYSKIFSHHHLAGNTFDRYTNKSVFIIDKYAGDTVVDFGKGVKAQICKIDVNDISADLFV